MESAKLQLITILPAKAFNLVLHLFNKNLFSVTLLNLNERICYEVIKWLRTSIILIKKNIKFIGEEETKSKTFFKKKKGEKGFITRVNHKYK
jgi:hypothetical protein